MHLKQLFSTLVLSAIGIAAHAQDKIYLDNGEVINAKVREVSPRTITYKKSDNPEGPDFIINKREVLRIKYANGTKDEMDGREEDDDRDHRHRMSSGFSASKEKYPMNILSIAPIQMANEGAAGIGLHYERVIDRRRSMFSFYLPFAAIFYNENRYNNNYNYNEKVTRAFCYFYPGIKIYPTGSNRRVSYGVGPSLALGFGNKNVTDYNYGNYIYREKSVFKSGILLNNSLNMQPTKNLYIGLELGLGFTYYNNEDDYNSNTFDSDEPLVQFNFAIGYRF